MTLYYRDDVNGGLLMPAGSNGPSVDPLVAEAVWLLRASTGTGENEGTAGSVLDSTVAYMDGTEKAHVAAPGNTGFVAQTADAAALDLTGDFCIAVDVHPLWAPPIPCQFVSKVRADLDDVYGFGLGVDGIPFLEFVRSGETAHEAFGFTSGDGADVDVDYSADTDRKQLILEFDADNGAGGFTAKFYEGTPGASPTLISSIVNTTDGAVTLATSSGVLSVGKPLYGAVYRVRVYSGRLASPTLVAEFYPDRDHTTGATMDAGGTTSETWTNLGIVEAEGIAVAVVPDDAALDLPAGTDATYAFWLTTPYFADVDTENITYASRAEGVIGGGGEGLTLADLKIDAYGMDGAGVFVAAGGGPAPAISNTGWAAGTVSVAATIDRDADTMTVYRDGAVHATADISSIGALDPAADLILTSAAHHAAAKWNRVLTADEIAALPYLLA